jgi:[acyl-carrier-protein] S-malonyltransferase
MGGRTVSSPGEGRDAVAVVFPGMGPTEFRAVAKFMLVDRFARELVAQADDVLGYRLFDRYRDTEGDYSVYAQLAMLVNCLALARWSEEHLGARPDVCAGPSFGGKAAAVRSGALAFADAVRLTEELARREEAYFALAHRDVVTHSFARVGEEALAEILGELTASGEWHDISCHVDHDFHMVSLRESGLERFQALVRANGGLPLYSMRPPLHSAAFADLRDEIDAEVLGPLRFADPEVPVVADQDGSVLRTGEEVRRMLSDGYVRRVRWPAVVAALRDLGVGTVHVCGPDSLFGRVGVTRRNFTVEAVDPRRALRPRRRQVPV